MKRFVLYFLCTWVILLACFGCRTARHAPRPLTDQVVPAPAHAPAPIGKKTADQPPAPPGPTGQRGFWGWGRAAPVTRTPAATAPRKCKGCVLVYGDATVAGKKATVASAPGAVIAGKRAGPVIRADSGATVQVATSARGPASAAGHDATAMLTKPSGTTWQAWLLRAGLVAGASAALWFGLPLAGPWLLALFRRKKSTPPTDNQA